MGRIAIGTAFLQLAKPLTWDLVNSRFARLKCNRARTAFQEEHKANKAYRQFYRQLALPAVTISNLQQLTAPGVTSKYLQSLLILALKRLASAVQLRPWPPF